MNPYAYKRGHKIIYKNNIWVYADTEEDIEKERPCIKCGKMPTKEGYDACLGYIKNATSVCCGHGRKEYKIKMIIKQTIKII